MGRIEEVQQRALAGDRAGARAGFATLWAEIGPDGDPLHAVTLAHWMADVQDDPAEELTWDRRALAAADRLTDERARRHHDSLAVRTFYPSLHLNLAADHAKLGDRDAAREHLSAAEAALPDLPEGGYGDFVRGGVERLREQLDSG
ncbi:MAG TPA: hypothetical protein VD813_07245 [Pseudonocardia sp.]|nr:hypothetical protein [Pseudonocardia sp.]